MGIVLYPVPAGGLYSRGVFCADICPYCRTEGEFIGPAMLPEKCLTLVSGGTWSS